MHQKRMSMPTSWKVPKKTNKWITAASPGPHNKNSSLPLGVILRDMLKIVDNAKEAKQILLEKKVFIDGIARKSLKFPVGLYDVIAIPANNQYYRMLQDSKGRLYLNNIDEERAKFKVCKILNKTTVKGGKTQLNLHDGTNILASEDYKTKDTIKISLPDKQILQKLEYKVGNFAMITGGRHSGMVGTIKEINIIKSSKNNVVTISGIDSEIETIENYVFVIGEDKPVIKLGE
ncbi:MAG: 30S ribosomal protein S4e [Methanosarcinales archaeon]|jgi:small subunit ribosomal protein S4e|nr:30S ribosomal protein S4e [Methanosarcinales archaeon]